MKWFLIIATYWLAVLMLTVGAALCNFTIYHDWILATAIGLFICGAGLVVAVVGALIHQAG